MTIIITTAIIVTTIIRVITVITIIRVIQVITIIRVIQVIIVTTTITTTVTTITIAIISTTIITSIMLLTSMLPNILMIGSSELFIIAAIVLLLFGGKKIPELMKSMGQGVRYFKKGMTEDVPEDKLENNDNEVHLPEEKSE